jgi:hypothetical protein
MEATTFLTETLVTEKPPLAKSVPRIRMNTTRPSATSKSKLTTPRLPKIQS